MMELDQCDSCGLSFFFWSETSFAFSFVNVKNIKAQLDQKKDVLASMEAELAKVSHWNSQVGGALPKCDLMLAKYTEQVGLLGDRWRRISGQIDTR